MRQIEPSATLAVDAAAKAMAAAGADVIGFGAGEPDFPTPPHVVEAAAAACRDPAAHHYSPTPGWPALRAAIADAVGQDTGTRLLPEQVVVTNGGKQAVYTACATLLDPGDEVLLPAPYWTTYPEAIRLAGGVPVVVPASATDGYRVSVAQLEAARTPRTKALLFCSPSNPTGAVYPAAQVRDIGAWLSARGLWALTDEIYARLVYPPATFASLLGESPEIADRTVVLGGVAKTYAMTGWRVGWLVAPREFATAAATLQSHLSSNVCNVAQAAALAALTGPVAELERMRAAFDARRKRMWTALRDCPGLSCPEPMGAFYCFPDVTGVLGREFGGVRAESSAELATLALEQIHLACVPGEAFGAPGHLRLSYALADAALDEGVRRLADWLARAAPVTAGPR